MTSMTPEERATLVAAMSDKTAMGRLNAGEITACFDRLVEMGYDIVKRPLEQKAPDAVEEKPTEKLPEAAVVENPILHPARHEPAHAVTRHRQPVKLK